MNASIRATIQRLKYILFQRGIAAHDAEDIVQDAFQRLGKYQADHEVTHVEGFLVRTAVNIAIDRARERRRLLLVDEPVENFVIADEAPMQDEVYASRERLERLHAGFANLDPLTRQMIRAQRLDGMSVALIADRHGLSVSAVEKRLSKGLKSLVDWMDGW
jgi:RNA polymerase sigma-70 factor (ECF subfamily)